MIHWPVAARPEVDISKFGIAFFACGIAAQQALHRGNERRRRTAARQEGLFSQKSRPTSSGYGDHTAVAVYGDLLPAVDTLGRHAGSQHRRHTVLPRHNGTVTQRAAHIGNNG